MNSCLTAEAIREHTEDTEKLLISILMPVRNGQKYLAESIDSVRNQSLQDWELIIVDDRSTDNTWDIIEDFSQKDSRIMGLNNRGEGIIAALQTAIEESSGKFISRMDSDDIMPIHRLALMAEALTDSEPRTVITGLVEYFGEGGISAGYKSYENWLNQINLEGRQWENIYRECVIASPNWMVRKHDIPGIGGFRALVYPEDYHLVFKWYQNDFTIKCIPETTLFWREHPDRTSRNSNHYSQGSFFDLKVREFLNCDDRNGDLVLWGAGVKGKLAANILMKHQRDFIWMDLVDQPTSLNGKVILPYTETKSYGECQLLVSVYPEEKERREIESYLNGLGMKKGRDYWYL